MPENDQLVLSKRAHLAADKLSSYPCFFPSISSLFLIPWMGSEICLPLPKSTNLNFSPSTDLIFHKKTPQEFNKKSGILLSQNRLKYNNINIIKHVIYNIKILCMRKNLIFFTVKVVKQCDRGCKFSILGNFQEPALSCRDLDWTEIPGF